MNLKIIIDIPPWEWSEDADKIFLEALRDDQADRPRSIWLKNSSVAPKMRLDFQIRL
jgi:hypothetical protein